MSIAKQLNEIERKVDTILASLGLDEKTPDTITAVHGTSFGNVVVDTVAQCIGISSEEVKSDRRSVWGTTARKVVSYILKKHSGYSLPRIGNILDKDHTSIYYYLNTVQRDKKENIKRYNHTMRIVKQVEDELGLDSNKMDPGEFLAVSEFQKTA